MCSLLKWVANFKKMCPFPFCLMIIIIKETYCHIAVICIFALFPFPFLWCVSLVTFGIISRIGKSHCLLKWWSIKTPLSFKLNFFLVSWILFLYRVLITSLLCLCFPTQILSTLPHCISLALADCLEILLI